MDIKQTMVEIYQTNVAKGFWDKTRNIGEMLMLVTSELSEALEADRNGDNMPNRTMGSPYEATLKYIETGIITNAQEYKEAFEKDIKNTFEDELADAVIRLFDICEGMQIDLPFFIRAKLEYNKLRPHKHGKKY